MGSSSRPCLVKTTRRTVIWHPEQIKVWCSNPRIASVFSGTTFVRISSASHAAQRIARTPLLSAHLLLGSIQHSERHPEVTRCGDELFVIDLAVNRRTLIPQGPTFVPVACESATTRLRRPGATTCSSCSVDARLMRGAACIGMGGLSVSRPPLMNATRCSVTWHAEQMNVWCSTPRAATVSSGTTFVRINSPPHAAQRITRTHLLGAHPGYPAG